jgi:hypothetical protein
VQCHLGAGELRRKDVSDLLPRKIVNPVKHRPEQRAADLQDRCENSGGQHLMGRPPSAMECGGEAQNYQNNVSLFLSL